MRWFCPGSQSFVTAPLALSGPQLVAELGAAINEGTALHVPLAIDSCPRFRKQFKPMLQPGRRN
jgi:hypothetical protein